MKLKKCEFEQLTILGTDHIVVIMNLPVTEQDPEAIKELATMIGSLQDIEIITTEKALTDD
jgi:hypothetical protein